MASKGISRGTKRILREYDVESRDSQEKIQQICTTQNSAVRRTESDHLCFGGNEDRPVNSKRWKTLFHEQTAGVGVSAASNIHNVVAEGQYSHSSGQASYQKTKQGFMLQNFSNCSRRNNVRANCLTRNNILIAGLIVTYQDLGDNIYICNYCNAYFWSEESLKQQSANAQPIYTNCCGKGKVKLERAKPTPSFLKKLLDPNNGLESRLFRENIRVYNSMFSFTSMEQQLIIK
ncbi:hypothetical protein RchiOBHm_Chr4g0413131 [Rosa chinensis]|uniref:Uncharacterized protein n=1 Tax=Rosa chinensis TaxID=74649 RepID=A0A2P6QVZ0_ROSCH|nr:uncharacterized protein LOC112197016 isoform X1 [Rosa chinensis]PRQ38368.1 hypothetical protein RchiOBHm_Chr4g0413131 [Rosa chinensis]